jgi:8-oxo-dGTP diphosphatase
MDKNPSQTYDISKYDKPSVTVDVIIFTIQDTQLHILLIRRKVWPFENDWALPGGFVKMKESLEEAAKRELLEEAGIENVYLEQLYTFGEPARDPRTRVITVAYFALIPSPNLTLTATTDASEAKWFSINDLPNLAFDHGEIIKYSLERLKSKINYTTIAASLLPDSFTLTQLQKVYEVILGENLDKRNFRKKILSLDLIEETKEINKGNPHRPAKLYRFKTKQVLYFN